MAARVADALDDQAHLLVQAGTGTGKSLGYLVPVMVHAVDSGERAVVSTATLALQRQVLTKDAPLGDAVFGVDNTFASRVLDEGVIDTSVSVTLPTGADQYVVGATPALVPIDFGEVSVNIDTTYFASKGLTAPATFEDLVKPDYKDLFVAINPSTSSPGLAFLLATIGHFGTAQSGGFADYWRQLVANGTRIDSGWTQAYETDFSGGGNQGAYPIVVSYSSSPAATVSPDGQSSTTASLPATAFRQVEYAGVLTGAANPAGAKAFIDAVTGKTGQKVLAKYGFGAPAGTPASGAPAAAPASKDPEAGSAPTGTSTP